MKLEMLADVLPPGLLTPVDGPIAHVVVTIQTPLVPDRVSFGVQLV